jgi:hypothetical protein
MNSKCFVYASLTVDRLPSAVMSFDDHLWTNRRKTGFAGYAKQPEAFASLACVISLVLTLVSNSTGSASRGRVLHIDSSADSSRSLVNAAWNVRYTVRLKLDTGDEQSVTVIAPPGGLQLVMRDMTGDHVPNDVVVTPALLHWPLTVLVNDGHQFSVAISGTFPNSASDRDRASSRQGMWESSALPAGNGETHAAGIRGRVVFPPQCEAFFSPVVTTVTASRTVGSGPERAPPSFVTNI